MSKPYQHAAWIRIKKRENSIDEKDADHYYINVNNIDTFYSVGNYLRIYTLGTSVEAYITEHELMDKISKATTHLRQIYDAQNMFTGE
jgi:hypothetical protein